MPNFSNIPVIGQAFAVYSGDLLFLAMSVKFLKFIANRWRECPELELPSTNADNSGFKTQSVYTILATVPLFDDTCDSLVVIEAEPECGNSLHTFRYLQADSQWSQPTRLQKSISCAPNNQFQSNNYHTTFASMRGYMFISNGIQIFSLNLTSRLAK